jgi:hypothetical protein
LQDQGNSISREGRAVTKPAWSPVRISAAFAFLSAAIVLPAAAGGGADDVSALSHVSAAERLAFLRRARVWEPTDVASKDLYNGPKGTLRYAVDQRVDCDFVPKPIRGWSEKFLCRFPDGKVLKVKYVDGDRFKEPYGEVLGSRLFWALGFPTDRILPLRVTCHGCPKRPWDYVNARHNGRRLNAEGRIPPLPPEAEAGTWTFDPASVEEPLDLVPIEEYVDQGWRWDELSEVDERQGGSPRGAIDALKLLAAFAESADNSAGQNELGCPRREITRGADGRPTCAHPVLYVDDLGAVFGHGGLTTAYHGRIDYDGWKSVPVWRNAQECRARLNAIGGGFRYSTLHHPRIGEAGRALLASLLSRLSDRQIADLFRAARVERLHQTTLDATGSVRDVTVKDWVTLFETKRDAIVRHGGCPES